MLIDFRDFFQGCIDLSHDPLAGETDKAVTIHFDTQHFLMGQLLIPIDRKNVFFQRGAIDLRHISHEEIMARSVLQQVC